MELAEAAVRVLVVDPYDTQREATASRLRAEGIAGLRVLDATDGQRTYRLAEEQRPRTVVVEPRMLAVGGSSVEIVRRLLGDAATVVVWSEQPLGLVGTKALLDAGADSVLPDDSRDALVEELHGFLPP